MTHGGGRNSVSLSMCFARPCYRQDFGFLGVSLRSRSTFLLLNWLPTPPDVSGPVASSY